jgi:hypothetical protein
VWPVLLSLEVLEKQQGDRLLLSSTAKEQLGILQIFATETPPYAWTVAALLTVVGTVVIALVLRGKWIEGIGWLLIGLAVGFGLAIGS